MKRFWEEGLGSVWMILAGKLSEAWFQRRRPTWGWLRTPRSYNYNIWTINTQYAWHSCQIISFLMLRNIFLKDEFLFLSHFFVPRPYSGIVSTLDTPRHPNEDRESNMGAMRITSWYPKFNGRHFGLPPSSTHRMTGLGGTWNGVNDEVCAQAAQAH